MSIVKSAAMEQPKQHKACIFCGKPPEKKNLEHILPLWLIKLTGDPKRQISIGPIYPKGNLKLSFDQLKYPSCSQCNSEYGLLEEKAKSVVSELLGDAPLSAIDLEILLDWFDKVRIGLWFYFRALNKELVSIKPNYHIRERVAGHDRCIYIFKMDCSRRGLTFAGVNLPTFYYLPACFALKIKHYYFINISYNYFLHQRLGLHYLKRTALKPNSELHVKEFGKAKGKMTTPLFDRFHTGECTEIYQPVFTCDFPQESETKAISNYQDGLRSENRNRGKVIFTKNKITAFYGDEKSKNWIPDKILHPGLCCLDIIKEVAHIQCRFLSNRKTDIEPTTKSFFSMLCNLTEEITEADIKHARKNMAMVNHQRMEHDLFF